jgi:hypothetical protein
MCYTPFFILIFPIPDPREPRTKEARTAHE